LTGNIFFEMFSLEGEKPLMSEKKFLDKERGGLFWHSQQ